MVEIDYSPEFHRILNESAMLLVQNRPAEAVEQLLPLYEIAPDHPDVLINLSGAYILQAKWNKAVALLTKAVERVPDNAMLWTNLGAAHLGRLETSAPRRQDRAIKAYQMALAIDPQAPNVHYHLGLIYKERGELNRACAFFQRALEVNPADRDARYWLDRMTQLLMEAQTNRTSDASLEQRDDDAPDSGAEMSSNGGPA